VLHVNEPTLDASLSSLNQSLPVAGGGYPFLPSYNDPLWQDMVNHTDPVKPTKAPIHEQDIHMESNVSHTKPPKRQRRSKITFPDAQILADEFLDNNLKLLPQTQPSSENGLTNI
jgi:hypothetical protein